MALTVTQGRTWVTGETVTAVKLNQAFSSATVNFSTFSDVSSPYNAVVGDFIFIAAGDTITLPASPSNNDLVTIAQLSGDMTSSNATISGGLISIDFNGRDTASATFTIDRNFCGSIGFLYNTAANLWKLV